MSSAAILEVVVPEKLGSAEIVRKPEIAQNESAGAPQKEESQTRSLLIAGLILGATMLSAMGGTLLIWVYLR
jgi:hypothetical protein